ncbi:hypothetical protein Trydic_g12619 [Trypoxylus dichotomus]
MSSKRLAQRKGVVSSSAVVNGASNSLDWDSPSAKTGTVKRRPVSSDCSPAARNKDNSYRTDKTTSKRNQDLYIRPPRILVGETDNYPSKTKGCKYTESNASTITCANLSLHDSINSDKIKSVSVKTSKCLNFSESGVYIFDRKTAPLTSHRTGKVSDSDSGIASPLSPSSAYNTLVYSDGSYSGWEDHSEWNLRFDWLENCSCVKRQVQIWCIKLVSHSDSRTHVQS